jgi:hypothetical protein
MRRPAMNKITMNINVTPPAQNDPRSPAFDYEDGSPSASSERIKALSSPKKLLQVRPMWVRSVGFFLSVCVFLITSGVFYRTPAARKR